MTKDKLYESPVDRIAREALGELRTLQGQTKADAIEALMEARDFSRGVSEKIFLLLATLLLPIIMYLTLDEPKFGFLGIEFNLDVKSIFFFFFIGNLFYVYKISHFGRIVAAEKVLNEISADDCPNLYRLIRLLPYNLFSLNSKTKAAKFYLKYFAITVYTIVYYTCLVSFLWTILKQGGALEFAMGAVLMALNALSTWVSVRVFPNASAVLKTPEV